MRRGLLFYILVLQTVALAGCVYRPPGPGAGPTATIVGSGKEGADQMLVRISGIDGRPVEDQDARLVISAGVHTVGIIVTALSGFGSRPIELTLDAHPDKNYVIRAKEPTRLGAECATSKVWIETEDKAVVGVPLPIMLVKFGRASTEMPIGTGGAFITIGSSAPK